MLIMYQHRNYWMMYILPKIKPHHGFDNACFLHTYKQYPQRQMHVVYNSLQLHYRQNAHGTIGRDYS